MIAGIRKKIESLLKSKLLIPVVDVDYCQYLADHNRRYYTTECADQNNTKYLLKVLIIDDQNYRQALENEILVSDKLPHQFKSFSLPKFLDYNNRDFLWYLKSYEDGAILGDAHAINDGQIGQKHVQQVIDALLELGEYNDHEKLFSNYTKNDYLKQLSDDSKYIPIDLSLKIDDIAAALVDESETASLVHGDLHFGNIIFNENGNLGIIDWALVHNGTLVEDFAKNWVSLWQSDDLQELAWNRFVANLKPDSRTVFNQKIYEALKYQSSKELRHWLSQNQSGKHKYPASLVKNGISYYTNLINILNDNSAMGEMPRWKTK